MLQHTITSRPARIREFIRSIESVPDTDAKRTKLNKNILSKLGKVIITGSSIEDFTAERDLMLNADAVDGYIEIIILLHIRGSITRF